MDQTTVQKCEGSQRCRMIAWMSQTCRTTWPFYKRQKKIITLPRGAYFRTQQIASAQWCLNYGGAVNTSTTLPVGILTTVVEHNLLVRPINISFYLKIWDGGRHFSEPLLYIAVVTVPSQRRLDTKTKS